MWQGKTRRHKFTNSVKKVGNMKKIILPILVLLAVWSSTICSADLYGKVWISPGAKPAFKVEVKIICKGIKYSSTVDKYGRYRLTKLPVSSKCKLKVQRGEVISGDIHVYSGTGSKSMGIELKREGDLWKVTLH